MTKMDGMDLLESTKMVLGKTEEQMMTMAKITGFDFTSINDVEEGAACGIVMSMYRLMKEYALHFAYLFDRQTEMLEDLREEVEKLRKQEA